MYKRRTLVKNEEVIIIFIKNRGFVEFQAFFKKYQPITVDQYKHDVPVFQFQEGEITGLDIFWIRKSDLRNSDDIKQAQNELSTIQYEALIDSHLKNITIPTKINDQEKINMANNTAKLIKQLGFDPADESWIEDSLADNNVEKSWFQFERLNKNEFTGDWSLYVQKCNEQFGTKLGIHEALELSKKRTRLLYGSMWLRRQGIADKTKWIEHSKKFEAKHRFREIRMDHWFQHNKNAFPVVKTKKAIQFHPGPYFKSCIEKVPHLFTDKQISSIKPGVELRILAYDNQEHYIALDFMEDISIKIRGKNEIEWKKVVPDYLIIVLPQDIEDSLESLIPWR